MGEQVEGKLDKLILMFNRFIDENHSPEDKNDKQVRAEWKTLRNILEDRPVKINQVYSHINRLEDKANGIEPMSANFHRSYSQKKSEKMDG
jgi:hypothetical protein